MPTPQFKVAVTHGATTTEYTPEPFTEVKWTKRENNYDVATLRFSDLHSRHYEDSFDHFDTVKIYVKDAFESAYTQVFGGWIRQVNPTLNSQGFLPKVICKGYGSAFEITNCNRDYGIESSTGVSYPGPQNVWRNVVSDFVEKSFAGDATGWAFDTGYVTDLYDAIDIKYINNPYRSCLDVINVVCDLTTAMGDGTTPGAHWIVDHNLSVASEPRLLIGKIGDHAAGADSPETYWPDWWNTDESGSTLVEGLDFAEYTIVDKMEEFANHILLLTDFRRPAYDYWTEDDGAGGAGSSLWGDDGGLTSLSDDAVVYQVGSYSVQLESNLAAPGIAYYPAAKNAAWDMTRWGSAKTIPRLNFYIRHDANVSGGNAEIRLFTTDEATDYLRIIFTDMASNNVWYHKSVPVGPNWASIEESKTYVWDATAAGAFSWANVNGVAFKIIGAAGANGNLFVDDLHFSGKVIRSAKNEFSISGDVGTPVTAKNEFQKVLISRNAMDDSCVAADDTGFAASIAYAELLRRQRRPKTLTFTTHRDMKAAMAGQKLHVHACRKLDDSTYRVDMAFRILELEGNLSSSGISYTVTATSDLYNSHPISTLDKYASWQENMFLNSKEAKNIRSGAEVDLLIPVLEKVYNSDDD